MRLILFTVALIVVAATLVALAVLRRDDGGDARAQPVAADSMDQSTTSDGSDHGAPTRVSDGTLRRAVVAGDSVWYQGERFELSKFYDDYDDYKNDPDNLAPGQEARLEKALAGVRLAPTYPDSAAMIAAVSALRFPGYGSTQFGEKPQPDGSTLAAYSVEIPKANKNRYIVFRGRGGGYTVVDDFVENDDLRIYDVRDEGGQLVYTTAQGVMVATRKPLAK